MNRRVVVVGAGITGLTAAYRIAVDHPTTQLVVLEAATRPGGRLVTSSLVGLPVDEGADAFLVRVPWAADLFTEAGLGAELVAPRARKASVWLDGALRPLPSPNVLGVPLDPTTVADGVLDPSDLKRLIDNSQPKGELSVSTEVDGDLSVGQVVRSSAGDAVFERLVDPLLGGINAGRADDMSCAVMAPQLLEGARHPNGLLASLRETQQQTDPTAPVFNTHPAGMGHLAERLADHFRGVLRLNCPVRSLTAEGRRWVVRSATGDETADAVVLATPATTAADLLSGLCPPVADTLARIEHASVSMATFVYRRSDAPVPDGHSGFLVPRSAGMIMTACSYSGSKWTHLDDGQHSVLRVSAGRVDDQRPGRLDDNTLVASLAAELAITVGIEAPPVAVRVSRWPAALAQFRPGHLARMADATEQLKDDVPGVVLAGAHHRGVGVPACVKSGTEAVTALASRLR